MTRHFRDVGSVDEVFAEVLTVANDGLSHEEIAQVISQQVAALKKQAEQLAKAEYGAMDLGEIARASISIAKSVDSLFRLVQFAKGQPDSRPDRGASWLAALTPEQFAQVRRWIEEAEARKV